LEVFGEYGPVIIRSINDSDQEILRDLMNSPDIENSVIGSSFPISLSEQKHWFKNIYPFENAIRAMIATDQNTIGCIVLSNIDWDNKVGYLGCKIRKEFQGNKYAYYANMAMIKYLFEKAGIERIVFSFIETNTKSWKYATRLGFRYEGIQREAIYKNNKRIGLVIWSEGYEDFKLVDKIGESL